MIVTVPTSARSVLAALMVAAATGATGCSQAVSPALVLDAQTAVRVKTALVNDPVLGVRPIEVTVANGTARLSGSVATPEEAQRAMDVARSVDGVRDVRTDLVVRPEGTGDELNAGAGPGSAARNERFEAESEDGASSLLAVGVSVRRSRPAAGGLEPATSVGPLFRLGSGRGLGITVGFGWFGADLLSGALPTGHVRIRPVMGGVGYTVGSDRVSASLSVVGGRAFNSVSRQERSPGPAYALEVRDSFAWRSNLSVWIDLNRRTAFNLSAGYVVTRPGLVMLEGGRVQERSLRADAAILSTGLAYKLF